MGRKGAAVGLFIVIFYVFYWSLIVFEIFVIVFVFLFLIIGVM